MDDVLTSGGPVLVLAPHPDDESLGCGGLLADAWRAGAGAHVICMTDGAASHPASRTHPAPVMASLRRAELGRAIGILGGNPSDMTWLGFPDAGTHLVRAQVLVQAIGPIADALQPGVLLAPSPLDPHCDHEATARAARQVAAARPGLALCFYPVWSAWAARTGRTPAPAGSRAIVRDHRNRAVKRGAIAAHRSQCGDVVRDDPEGFVMPPGFAAWFAQRPETYFLAAP